MLKAVFWAIRPKTLSISLGPVLIGSAIAMEKGNFDFGIFILIALAALCIQVTANLSNDLFDGIAGVDSYDRLGPTRVTAAGLLSKEAVAALTAFSIFISVAAGFILVLKGGTAILLIGSSAILSALLYTAGPYPLGKLGLGELFVFFYFGPAAVLGTVHLHGGDVFSLSAFLAGISTGLLGVAMISINNLRDIASDQRAGKKTLAVRFGSDFGKIEISLSSLSAALLLFILGLLSHIASVCSLSGIALIPFLIRQHRLYTKTEGRWMNRLLEELSFSIFTAGLLFFLLCLI